MHGGENAEWDWMMHESIVGFEFLLVSRSGRERWEVLQGSGGAWGAGALHALNDESKERRGWLARVKVALLVAVRAELEREGSVRVYREHLEPSERIRKARPREVRDVREVRR